MTKKKQYKKRLPAVLPPSPRAGSDPHRAAEVAAPVPPAPRTPDSGPETASDPEPRPAVPQATADFVREMKQRAGVVEATPLAEPLDGPEPEVDVETPEEPVDEAAVRTADRPTTEEAPTPRRDARRRIGVLALVLGVLLGVAVVGTAYWWTARDDGAPRAEGAWTAPEGLDPDEGYVETRVHADGTMEVRQWMHADEALERVTLRIPRVTSAGQLAAQDVEVLADGEPVEGRGEITYFAAAYDLGGASEVELRYRLVGAVERSSSAPGRALAVATALDARFSPAPAREVRVVKAPEVLSLACARSADASPVPCGTPDGDGEWHVELAGRRAADRVIASVTIG